MKKLFFILVITLVIIGISYVFGYVSNNHDSKNTIEVAGVSTSRGEIMKDKFFYVNNFYQTVDLTESVYLQLTSNKIRAAIVPHDITQGQMIAHLFQSLVAQNPKRLILLGPNHYESGNTKLVTTTADWKTEFGYVRTDDYVIANLLPEDFFSQSREIIENEHSVSALVPFISYYLPDVEVIPIIFKANIRQYEIDPIIKLLEYNINEDTVIIAAVDFSHYLTKEQASINDEKIQNYLESLDYQSILNLGENFNDYLDSPAVIGLLLKWLEQNDYSNYQMVDHANSADENGNPNVPTTSYFEIIYY